MFTFTNEFYLPNKFDINKKVELVFPVIHHALQDHVFHSFFLVTLHFTGPNTHFLSTSISLPELKVYYIWYILRTMLRKSGLFLLNLEQKLISFSKRSLDRIKKKNPLIKSAKT